MTSQPDAMRMAGGISAASLYWREAGHNGASAALPELLRAPQRKIL